MSYMSSFVPKSVKSTHAQRDVGSRFLKAGIIVPKLISQKTNCGTGKRAGDGQDYCPNTRSTIVDEERQ